MFFKINQLEESNFSVITRVFFLKELIFYHSGMIYYLLPILKIPYVWNQVNLNKFENISSFIVSSKYIKHNLIVPFPSTIIVLDFPNKKIDRPAPNT